MGSSATEISLSLQELIDRALHGGIVQVEAVGSPLHPLLFDDTGRMFILYSGEEQVEPMVLAIQAIREHCPDVQRCALAIDTRLTMRDGKKWDAITVLACSRDEAEGTMWAQCYVPKRLLRKFRTEGEPEEIGTIRNYIALALQDAAA
ncbi:MAG: hypothetical protein IT355_08525 [Gemmatimonadaceae bacterium]|nr:hypothetical protein [Gemmatimonadaceae bacterium]